MPDAPICSAWDIKHSPCIFPASFLLLLLTCVQVCLAMLLGSDYTEGVSGIGVVNALEVVSAWPDGLTGLAGFKQWMDSPDERILAAATAALRDAQGGASGSSPQQAGGKRARSSRGRGSRGGREAAGRGRVRTQGRRGGRRGRGRKAAAAAESSSSSSSGEEEEVDSGHGEALAASDGEADAAGAGGTEQGTRGGSSSQQGGEGEGAEHGGGDTLAQRRFKTTHRGVSRSWNLPAHFPSNRVHEAYLRPLVDHNPAKFGFDRPDGALLTQFCR